MRVSAVLTQTAGVWLAECEEVDRAGEGKTPDEALANLREALAEYFAQAEAVAPPPSASLSHEPIEIVVLNDPRSPS
jgi:predicted RNase H-like HicB family nuclease